MNSISLHFGGFPPRPHSATADLASERPFSVLVIHGLLILWSLLASAVCGSMEPVFALSFACLMFTGLSVWVLASWLWTGGRILSPYALFLISALVFNGGQIWLRTFDPGLVMLDNEVPPIIMLKTVLVVTHSIMFLHLGALFLRRRIRPTPVSVGEGERRVAARTGVGLFLIAAGPAIATVYGAIQAVMAKGYLALYQSEQPTGVQATPRLIATIILPATFLIFASSKSRLVRLFCIGTLIAFSIAWLFLGGRAAAVTTMAALAWLWEMHVGRIRSSFIVGAAAAAVVLLPLIAVVRQVNGNERSSLTFLWEALSRIDNPAAALLYEMGGSAKTVAHTMVLIPALRDYDQGASYGYAALTALPNVFGGPVHPTTAHGTLSIWLVNNVDPLGAAMGLGLGYSFIAEGYANFGWAGNLFVMSLLGMGIQAAANWVEAKAVPSRLAAVASGLTFLLVFARAESADLVRGLVWYAVIPYSIVRLAEFWSNRKATQTIELPVEPAI